MSLIRRAGALLAVPIAAVAVGCGGTVVDDEKTEGALKQNLNRALDKNVKAVDCPSDIEVEAGATFRCTVELAGGREETATLRIRNEDADVEVTGLGPAK